MQYHFVSNCVQKSASTTGPVKEASEAVAAC
jgi:hypothetical protein